MNLDLMFLNWTRRREEHPVPASCPRAMKPYATHHPIAKTSHTPSGRDIPLPQMLNHPSSWKHRQSDLFVQSSWSVVHGHEDPSSDEDHDERGSSLGVPNHHEA